ncbi:MAG: hypothetical protein K2X87_25270 [Gemmataceae bacterium]|nr:hypothetical protein [Gemmataceae bacterium]
MTLGDAGGMVALVNKDDIHHARCKAGLATLPPGPLLTTWPALTEAMHRLGREIGPAGQDELWQLIAGGLVVIHPSAADEGPRRRDLMAEYADAPMDLADASPVVAAEPLGLRRVFTLDRHFYAYRADGEPFEVIP